MAQPIDHDEIVPISETHGFGRFCCGNQELDHFLHEFALEHDAKHITRSYVATDDEKSILGFYSLSTASVEFEKLVDETLKHLPQYPIPAAMITRLAVDNQSSQRNVAEKLLIDALRRIIEVEREMAIKVVVVQAADNAAIAFYLRFGFMKLPGLGDKLFLPMETVRKAMS